MLGVLADTTYRRLFAAQALSLIGTGLTTVALGLLAFELAGEGAGMVLGTVLMLKMVAYVGFAPIAGAFSARFDRKRLLVTLDLLRAAFVLGLPFITAVWQVYLLVFAFQLMSAAFTPTFQATIPDVLEDETRYANALALSRLAYDLESLLSPLLAGLLMSVISFHALFAGTTLGFLLSAALVLGASLPAGAADQGGASFADRLTRGMRIYLATPRLRGLLALNVAVASVGAMVIVNSIVHVRTVLGAGEQAYALVLMAGGAGSMAAALAVPWLCARWSARQVMLTGGVMLVVVPAFVGMATSLATTLPIWALLGAAMSLVATPGGLLLRRSAHAPDRPAVFAAQFSLSHACWLVTYPAAGWLGAAMGIAQAFFLMAAVAALGLLAALRLWPAEEAVGGEGLVHRHAATAHEHLHSHDEHHQHAHEGWEGPEPHRHPHRHAPVVHRHPVIIDDHHPAWPR